MTTQSDHLLNFILVVSDSTSQSVALVDSELVCLRPVAILKVVVIFLFCCFIGSEKPLWGRGQLSTYVYKTPRIL